MITRRGFFGMLGALDATPVIAKFIPKPKSYTTNLEPKVVYWTTDRAITIPPPHCGVNIKYLEAA